MPTLPTIREKLTAHSPTLAPRAEGGLQAAVALLLHEPAGGRPELLFIERATLKGDPWSGHMAFPGGRRDPSDTDTEETARRETREEVGIELSSTLGRLDDFSGSRDPRVPPIVVAAYVHEVTERPRIVANPEVNATVWVPLDWILGPESAVEYQFEREGELVSFPAFRYERYIVWGLTYRILSSFFSVLDRELPSHQRG